MDPDAALAAMRAILARSADRQVKLEDAVELLELFEALDVWLVRGGALPRAWNKVR